MKYLSMFGLIFFLLIAFIMNGSLSLQLSGAEGKAILELVSANNTINRSIELNNTLGQNNTTAPNNSIRNDLWSWGSVPVGHLVNESGKLAEKPNGVWFVEIPPKMSQ